MCVGDGEVRPCLSTQHLKGLRLRSVLCCSLQCLCDQAPINTKHQGLGELPWLAILHAHGLTSLLGEVSTVCTVLLGQGFWKFHAWNSPGPCPMFFFLCLVLICIFHWSNENNSSQWVLWVLLANYQIWVWCWGALNWKLISEVGVILGSHKLVSHSIIGYFIQGSPSYDSRLFRLLQDRRPDNEGPLITGAW